MTPLPPIQRLSNEILRHILDQIEPDPERTVPIDDRRFISVETLESVRFWPPSDSVKDIGDFRRTCKRFAEIGAPLLFTLVKARFSTRGLERLEQFADWSHLTGHVKKFSYLVPYFYSGDERLSQLETNNGAISGNLGALRRKVREQKQIVDSDQDVRVLKKAFKTFRSLQFVKLLPVVDQEDEPSQALGDAQRAPAISRGSHTIGKALLYADIPWSRLYLQVENASGVEFLALPRPPSLSILAARLTCLALVFDFDERNDLDDKMVELSNLFRTVFKSAQNMQAVHIGFLKHRPWNLPLEDVFHHVKWDKLTALGVAGWDLHADEIISLALRHKERLRGLRLRDVHLKEGGMWKDVLGQFKDSLHSLKWISLRRIDYAHESEDINGVGAEVPDGTWASSESDSDNDPSGDEINNEDDPGIGPSNLHRRANGSLTATAHGSSSGQTYLHTHVNGNFSDIDDFDAHDDTDDEHEPEANATDFPNLDSPTTSVHAPWSDPWGEETSSSTVEDLEDDGQTVSNIKRKFWERWVISR